MERREEAQKEALVNMRREIENLERSREVDRGVLVRRERKVCQAKYKLQKNTT